MTFFFLSPPPHMHVHVVDYDLGRKIVSVLSTISACGTDRNYLFVVVSSVWGASRK
jgi:hypothetical protein